MTKERRLGRGLAALLGNPADQAAAEKPINLPTENVPEATTSPEIRLHPQPPNPRLGRPIAAEAAAMSDTPKSTGILHLNVYEIDDNPFQPRRDFSESEIASLSESLKEHQMLQPVLVRQVGQRYQLISGERRLRAAIQAGWATVPAQLREADDRLVAELAIVENLQRKDLNPIEKALSFKRYLDEHQSTQEELANRLKIDRSTIANLLRLLELPEQVMQALQSSKITAGHARAMLPLGEETEQITFCEQIIHQGMSVRETERQVQEKIKEEDFSDLDEAETKKIKQKRTRSQQIASLEQQLRIALGTKVDIRQANRGRGKIVIHFTSGDEFERIRDQLTDHGTGSIQNKAG